MREQIQFEVTANTLCKYCWQATSLE